MPRRLALMGALAALLAPLAACGRKAAPEPPEGVPKDAFPKHYPPPGT
jgi:predicted small lipoprotein YifL